MLKEDTPAWDNWQYRTQNDTVFRFISAHRYPTCRNQQTNIHMVLYSLWLCKLRASSPFSLWGKIFPFCVWRLKIGGDWRWGKRVTWRWGLTLILLIWSVLISETLVMLLRSLPLMPLSLVVWALALHFLSGWLLLLPCMFCSSLLMCISIALIWVDFGFFCVYDWNPVKGFSFPLLFASLWWTHLLLWLYVFCASFILSGIVVRFVGFGHWLVSPNPMCPIAFATVGCGPLWRLISIVGKIFQ